MTTAVQLAQSVAPGVSLGFKNRIINGAMMIDQRNAGAAVTLSGTSSAFGVDRNKFYSGGGGAYTAQQVADAPAGFAYSTKITITTADASIAAGDYYQWYYNGIEGNCASDLAWGTASAATVTLSFYVKASIAGTYSGAIQASSGSYTFSYTVSAANTWERMTVTITGATSYYSTYTWPTGNTAFLYLVWDLGSGSSTEQATGWTYTGTSPSRIAGTQKLISTLGATLQITGVQLEKGSTATSFDYRPYGTELALCQRYYEKVHFVASAYYNGANGCACIVPQNVQKRASPTVTRTNDNWGGWNTNFGSTYNEASNEFSVYTNAVGSAVGFIRYSTDILISAEL